MTVRKTIAVGLMLYLGSAAADWTTLRADLESLRLEGNVPAVGLVIITGAGENENGSRPGGEPIFITLGDGLTPDTPFRWGSITKTFTALAALRLVEQGKLRLDQPMAPLLAKLGVAVNNPWSGEHPVRLSHLLALSAGSMDLSGIEFNQLQPLTLTAALKLHPRSRNVHWPPGLQHSYTNVSPGLTAAAIESVSAGDFESIMDGEVFRPLGMAGASLVPVPGLPGGFRADGTTPIPYWHVLYRGFGGLNASLRNMGRLLDMLRQRGRLDETQVFEPATVDRLLRPLGTLGARAGLEVGYGAGAYGRIREGHLWIGHGGDADGYRARYAVLLAGKGETDRGYALVMNTDNPRLLQRMERVVEAALSKDLPVPPRPPRVDLNDAQLDSYTGRYYPASLRFRRGGRRDGGRGPWHEGRMPAAHMRAESGDLWFKVGSRTTRLIPLGRGRFRRGSDPAVTVVIAENAQGARYLQGELGNFVHLKDHRCPGFIGACDPQ